MGKNWEGLKEGNHNQDVVYEKTSIFFLFLFCSLSTLFFHNSLFTFYVLNPSSHYLPSSCSPSFPHPNIPTTLFNLRWKIKDESIKFQATRLHLTCVFVSAAIQLYFSKAGKLMSKLSFWFWFQLSRCILHPKGHASSRWPCLSSELSGQWFDWLLSRINKVLLIDFHQNLNYWKMQM